MILYHGSNMEVEKPEIRGKGLKLCFLRKRMLSGLILL